MKRQISAKIFLIFFIAAIIFCAPHVNASSTSYFDMTVSNADTNLEPFPKWTTMVERYETQSKASDDDCDKVEFHPCDGLAEWGQMLDSLQGKSLRTQMKEVNDWANDHPYILDQVNWGVEDYWETPYEFMTVNGDCEDYAIAKYYSLRLLGVPPEKMRVMIVQDLNLGGVIHAILGVDVDDQLIILDNQIKQVIPAMKIYHYRPIYGINENWWWAYTPKYTGL